MSGHGEIKSAKSDFKMFADQMVPQEGLEIYFYSISKFPFSKLLKYFMVYIFIFY